MSEEYTHIDTIWKRDDKGKIIVGDFSCQEFEYLADNQWTGTEKVDGANIRVIFDQRAEDPNRAIEFKGKTDNAQIPPFLIKKLGDIFYPQLPLFREKFPEGVTLYGEGYGARIQKGGGNYLRDGVDFVLFDVKINFWWLKREGIEDTATSLGIKCVPLEFAGTLEEATFYTKTGFNSNWGEFQAEGLVLKPKIDMFNRKGERIIAKIKHKDFS